MNKSSTDRIGSVTADNSDLKTQITRVESSPRIATWATRHGMVAVLPGDVTPLTAKPVHGG